MYQSFLIEVETVGTYRVEQTGGSWLQFERCVADRFSTKEEAAEQWVDTSVWFNAQEVGSVEFEHPGLWRFDVLQDHGPAQSVSVTITPDW